ncbi:hypothetical protein [Microbacterium xanthum]|uniref:hypothetical protein n=1 Tax=Microbacterium xanthum TaxID=3079794 RepID=UPI002AD20181|nr:hypothetical protein [Microbacterium sp. KSW-48]MDZ8172209.1 hypothetical protein [Microbacterium sp. KSW-48]
MEQMSAAAHVGDIEEMRAIFSGGLAEMLPRSSDVDMIAEALEEADLDVLRHMFA